MPLLVPPSGPVPARIMLCGEAPGAEEEARGEPFVGASGSELTRMLHEAGINRSECFITNVCRERPLNNDINQFIAKSKKDITPAHILARGKFVRAPVVEGLRLLERELSLVKPNVVVAFGNVPLWALTGREGITKWRGSMLDCSDVPAADFRGGPNGLHFAGRVIPTYHPAAVLRQWDWRATVIQDLRRAARFSTGADYPKPAWNFILRPSFPQVLATLDALLARVAAGPTRLSFDLETRAGHIACAGISWTLLDAICIPLMCVERREGYWSPEEEAEIVHRLYRLLTHPNAQVVGQNILYDSQYTYRHWHFVPRVAQDCMISWHSLFADLPKSLAYQASLLCDYYVYWKDEGKNWDPKMGEDQLWHYNCLDCVYTDEGGQRELELAKSMGLEAPHNFQQSMFWPVLQAMQRGVRIDTKRRDELILEVTEEVAKREQFLLDVLGHPLNPRSPKQMQALFYEDLKLPVQMTRAKKGQPSRPTLDDEALQKLARIEPLAKPLINAISDIRTLGIFLGSFLLAPLDIDRRMRCAYNIGGSASGKSAPKTYRLSSSENAFGGGTNLQTIPSEKSKSLGKAAARGTQVALGDPYQFPNIRSMFVPDPGYTFFDLDLDRADLQVVVWEADDPMLKAALRMGVDIHLMNAFSLAGKDPPPLDELVETHPRYGDHRGPRKHAREFAKVFCHGTNYGGQPRTMSAHTGRTIAEIDRTQRLWFGAHPGIQRWHNRVKDQVTRFRFIENRFGYRWHIFDRIDSIIPEAIAWIPQSTVSIVINRIWRALYDRLPAVQVLLQVHDSLAGQLPTAMGATLLPQMRSYSQIPIQYPDPLVIPTGIKLSDRSWGHCV